MHHCPRQKVFLRLAYTTVSDLMSILPSHCQSQFSHPGCKEGHFWLPQWEEVGTVLYQAQHTSIQQSSAALLIAELHTEAKN